MKRFAFTMLELVFVIIVIGIIAVLAIPNFSTSPLQQATEQIAGHIRYTQHLAMMDDKYNDQNATWYKERWQIRFRLLMGEYGYVVFSDRNQNRNSNQTNPQEIAVDPLSGEFLNGFLNYHAGNLTQTYGITNVIDNCLVNDGTLVTSNKGAIVFDHMGRPYNGVSNATSSTQYLLANDCNITIVHPTDGNSTITVHAETGYVSVRYN